MKGFQLCHRISAVVLAPAALLTLAIPTQASEQHTAFAIAFDGFEVPILPLQPESGAVDIAAISPSIGDGRIVVENLGSGTASYYGRRFHGRLTANGESFDMHALTAAHRTLPFGSFVRVTNPRNGRSVTVRINDRGPFVGNRVIDLSRAAAEKIGLIRPGHAEVMLALVEG